jgi:adenylate cyclase
MFSQSIRRKIVGIALGLVVLMIGTSILSMLMANRVDHLLDELINKYVPTYGTWRAPMCARSSAPWRCAR